METRWITWGTWPASTAFIASCSRAAPSTSRCPSGDQRLEFNAHRVFALGPLLDLLGRRYRVDSFSYVDDANRFHAEATLTEGSVADNFGCHYACGVFELTRLWSDFVKS